MKKRLIFLAALLILSLLMVSCGGGTDAGTTSPSPGIPGMPENIERNPVAAIEFDDGRKILIELYPDIAPNTVCNFISLANSGVYKGSLFHRVFANEMIQGGMALPGNEVSYSIKGEFTTNGFKNDLKHERGVISMARTTAPDSASSQFFLVLKDAYPSWDTKYAAFGKIIEGIEIADEISLGEITDSINFSLVTRVAVKDITVDTFGVEYPEPVKN